MHSITIGIPTLNRAEFLKNTVLSVINNKIINIDEIIIVDQTINLDIISENEIYFNSLNFKIRYILLNEPSVCKARNIIIKESRSDIIFFIDDDILIPKNYFNEHLYLYESGSVVSTIGKIYNRIINFNINDLDILNPKKGTEENFPNDNFITYNFEGAGISCNQSYLRKVLLEIKGFDENYQGGYFEDTDLIERIKQKGYKIGFNPNAYILHLKAPMGGLRFDDIQPISYHIKFYSFLFFYVRYFVFNTTYLFNFYKILRAGPLLKKNIFSFHNGFLLWIKLPFLIIKCLINRNKVKSILNYNVKQK